MVGRTESKKAANLVLEWAEISGKLTLEIAGKEKEHAMGSTDFPKVPYLTNPSKVSKNTKLLTLVDSDLNKLREKAQSEAMKEKEDKEKEKAKAEKEKEAAEAKAKAKGKPSEGPPAKKAKKS